LALLATCTGVLADDQKDAAEGLKYTQALFEHNHFVAEVALEVEQNRFVRFHYDRFGQIETVAKEGQFPFQRRNGGAWEKADEWDKKLNPEVSPEEAEELNNTVSLVYNPFATPEFHDQTQGASVWKFISKRMDKSSDFLTYERTRETPKEGGVYPRFTFVRSEDLGEEKMLLGSFTAQVSLNQRLIPIRVEYGYDRPEDWLRSAKAMTDRLPCRVDALITGEHNMKVRGILAGEDFDLSIKTLTRDLRQIKSGTSCWQTTDQGKTWAPLESADLSYYNLVHSPIKFKQNERIPPFKTSPQTEENGRSMRVVQFISPDPVRYGGDRPNYWLFMDELTPTGICRYLGPLVWDNGYVGGTVEYHMLSTSTRVLPPPGNPEALPKAGPEDLLFEAERAMDRNGPIFVSAVSTYTKTAWITGTISHEDFDLIQTPEDQSSQTFRAIAIGKKAWATFDGGKKWKTESAEDRMIFNLVYAPIVPNRLQSEFEVISSEKHGQSTWIHIAAKIPGKIESEDQRPHYWIEVDEGGKAVAVRRYEGGLAGGGVIINCKTDYTLLPPSTKLHPPRGKQ